MIKRFLMFIVVLVLSVSFTGQTQSQYPDGQFNNLLISGLVGIGIQSPGARLDVDGSIRSSGIVSAQEFVGGGANITELNAANLTGTLSPALISSIDVSKLSGVISINLLPVGTGSGQVARGDHNHDSRYAQSSHNHGVSNFYDEGYEDLDVGGYGVFGVGTLGLSSLYSPSNSYVGFNDGIDMNGYDITDIDDLIFQTDRNASISNVSNLDVSFIYDTSDSKVDIGDSLNISGYLDVSQSINAGGRIDAAGEVMAGTHNGTLFVLRTYNDGQNQWVFSHAASGSSSTGGLCINTGGDSCEVSIDSSGNIRKRGTNSFVEPHPTDSTKEIVYVSLEGPEAGTYIRGTAQLVNGEAVIEFPQHFGFVTAEEGLTVQMTPVGQYLRLYVVEKNTSRLIVREADGKNGTFDYMVFGIRKGFENYEVIRDK